MDEQQKVESGEQEEEKELTAKEKIELERQEEILEIFIKW